jgi:hypothetical protein
MTVHSWFATRLLTSLRSPAHAHTHTHTHTHAGTTPEMEVECAVVACDAGRLDILESWVLGGALSPTVALAYAVSACMRVALVVGDLDPTYLLCPRPMMRKWSRS